MFALPFWSVVPPLSSFLSSILDFFLYNSLSLTLSNQSFPGSMVSEYVPTILPCCFISFLICNNMSQNSLSTPLITLSIYTTVILEIRDLITYLLYLLSSWKVFLNCQSSPGKAQSFIVRLERQSETQHVFTLFSFITNHCLLCTFESGFHWSIWFPANVLWPLFPTAHFLSSYLLSGLSFSTSLSWLIFSHPRSSWVSKCLERHSWRNRYCFYVYNNSRCVCFSWSWLSCILFTVLLICLCLKL